MSNEWEPLRDGDRVHGWIRRPEYQGEGTEVIDYDNPWESRELRIDEWGNQTVIRHEMGG